MQTVYVRQQAEEWVINAALMDFEGIMQRTILEPHHFAIDKCAAIFSKCVKEFARGFAYTAGEAIIDGHDIPPMLDANYSFTHLPTYEAQIIDAWKRRKALKAGQEILETSSDPDRDIEEAYNTATSFATEGSTTDRSITTWESLASSFEGDLAYYAERSETGSVAKWPWHSWQQLGSPEPGMGIIVGARESTGKTVYLEMMAEEWAQHGLKVGLFHLELNPRVVRRRQMTRLSGVPENRLRSGKLTDAEMARIRSAQAQMARWRGSIEYIHSPGWDATRIVRVAAARKYDAILVDYFQRLNPSQRESKYSLDPVRWTPLAIQTIKVWAEDAGAIWVAASQLSNEGKQGEPDMKDLRWAKELSEAGNVVLLAWRDFSDDGEVRRGTGEVITEAGGRAAIVQVKCTKNTQGPTLRLPNQRIEGPRFRILDIERG